MSKRKSTKLPFEGWIMTGQAAKLLGVSRRHVDRLIASGKLEAVKVAERWLVNPETVEALKRKREEKPIE